MQVYSFLNTVLLVNSVEITGWAEGDDVIDVKRLADSASHKIGSHGEMMVTISADRSGSFKFKLQQTSPSNSFLLNLINLQEGGGITFTPVTVQFQDVYRQDMASGTVGYIKRPADIQRGATAGNQEWEIIVERLDMLVGADNLVTAALAALA